MISFCFSPENFISKDVCQNQFPSERPGCNLLSMAKPMGFWAQLWIFEKGKIEPWVAFRASLGMAIAVGVGYLLHSTASSLAIAIGALNVCYSDKSDAYRERGRRMLAASVLCSAAVFVATYSANIPELMFVLMTLGAFLAGMLVIVDSIAADLGVISLATFFIFSSQALNSSQALEMSLLALAGGLLQSLISVALWPFRRYKPERRALSNLYQDLAFLAVSAKYTKGETPLGSLQSIETQNALVNLSSDNRQEARRYRSLLSQAERLRITVLSLLRLRKRLLREQTEHFSLAPLADILEATSNLLRAISLVVASGKPLGVADQFLVPIEDLTTQIRSQRSTEQESPFSEAVLSDLIFQLDSLGGQLRAASELALKTTWSGIERAERLEASRPVRLRFWSVLATLRANMTFQSPGFRHAIRLSLCIGLAEVISRIFQDHLQRAYWIPMTIAIVLKPDYASTFSRSLLRICGTLLGLVIATGLFHLLPQNAVVMISLIVFFTFMTRWIGSANYGIFALCVGALVVLLLALAGVSPKEVIWARGVNTLLGGGIAILIYWCWPTSEKLQISEVTARMLDSYLQYFKAVASAVEGETQSSQELDHLRQKARVARANFQAASGRFTLEIGAAIEDMKVLSAVTVASNRFAHAMMSLEAGAAQDKSLQQVQAFREFAKDVEKNLLLLGEVLRGKKIGRNEFPDLRGSYVIFSQSRSADSERHTLLYEEADRMTNSLLTLTEQILKRIFTRRLNRARKETSELSDQ